MVVLNNTFENILPNIVKVSVTKDDVRFESNLKINQTLFFIRKSFSLQF